jgi:hypothetical protein
VASDAQQPPGSSPSCGRFPSAGFPCQSRPRSPGGSRERCLPLGSPDFTELQSASPGCGQWGQVRPAGAQGSRSDSERGRRGCPLPRSRRSGLTRDPVLSLSLSASTWKEAQTYGDVLRVACPPSPSLPKRAASFRKSQSVAFESTEVWQGLRLSGGLAPVEQHFLLSVPGWQRPPPRSRFAPRLGRDPCASYLAPAPGTRARWTQDPASEGRTPFGWTISGGGRGVGEPHTRASP